MKLSTREKILLGFLVWSLMAYIFYNCCYSPLNRETAVWKEKNNQLEQEVAAAQEANNNRNNMAAQNIKYKDEYARLARQVPAAAGIAEIIAFMEENAGQSGVRLLAINHKGPDDEKNTGTRIATDGGVNYLDFDLSAAGGYYHLVSFLKGIEQADRIYTLESVKMLNCPSPAQSAPVFKENYQLNGPQELDNEGPDDAQKGMEAGSLTSGNDNRIIMNLKVRAYYYEKSWPGIEETHKLIEPPSDHRDNPFSQ